MASRGREGADENELLDNHDNILGRLKETVLFATAHSCCVFFDTDISWCGKMYSGRQVSHDRERLGGLASMPHVAAQTNELE